MNTEPREGVPPAARDRILELDALRGLAALAILGLHTLHRYFFWAWSAVDLFFILSGFLITSILIANRDSPRMLLSFYVRRALRIWPVYYIAFLGAVALHFLFGFAKTGAWVPLPVGNWLSLIFLQYIDRYFEGGATLDYLWYFDHSWSLAVEEQFYLVWPLVFFLLRPRLPSLMLAGVAVLTLSAWARSEGMYFWILPTRVDGLIYGIALAYLAAQRTGILYRLRLWTFACVALAALATLLPYLISRGEQNLFGPAPLRALETSAFCVMYAAAIGAAIRFSGAWWLAPLRTGLLTYFGRISFAIYMYQVPIAYLLLEGVALGNLERWQCHVLTWILTIACAHLSYGLIERRALALKARFPYR